MTLLTIPGRQLSSLCENLTIHTTRPLSTATLEWNLPKEALGKTATQLFEEGHINKNVAQWLLKKQREERAGTYGAKLQPTYQPAELVSKPPSIDELTLPLLLASQAHLGHNTSLWNPSNAQYIFGVRDGIHIISLDATASHLRRAARVVESVSRRGGLILFVGTRKGQQRAVVKAAKLTGGYHLFDKYIPGTFTNGLIVLRGARLGVVDQLDRKLEGFEEQLEGLGTARPDLVVCLNPMENVKLLHECALCNIPTVGIIDTNASPQWVTYPIPANDDR
jgi:small subunit ribosomal protein S2